MIHFECGNCGATDLTRSLGDMDYYLGHPRPDISPNDYDAACHCGVFNIERYSQLKMITKQDLVNRFNRLYQAS